MKKLLLAALASGFLASTAQAKVEIKLSTAAPAGTPWVTHLEAWEKKVEELSKGEIDVVIFPGGQLGTEIDVFKQVQRGRIDAASLSGGAVSAYVKELSLMSTPFLFDDTKTLDCVYDSAASQRIKELIDEKGLTLLQWAETGWVHTYAQDDLSEVDAAKGYKIRVAPHAMSRLIWDSVGANGTELPYAETPAALQTGLVKGGESAEVSYVAFGIGKVAPHLMMSYNMHQSGGILISNRTMKKLSDEQKKILSDALPDVQKMRQTIRGMGEAMVKKYAENGGPVHYLSSDQRAAWKAKVEPNWPEFVKSLGGKSEELWPAILEAKAACEK